MKIKSITLSITELTNLLSIDSADVRRQALEALNEAVAEPENIDIERYRDSHPVVQAIVEKVDRRARSACRRAESRAARKQQKQDVTIRVEMTDSTVKRLLWLRQNLHKTLGRLNDALTAQSDDPIGARMALIIDAVMESTSRYINPMMEAAAAYMRAPKKLRPEAMDVVVSL